MNPVLIRPTKPIVPAALKSRAAWSLRRLFDGRIDIHDFAHPTPALHQGSMATANLPIHFGLQGFVVELGRQCGIDGRSIANVNDRRTRQSIPLRPGIVRSVNRHGQNGNLRAVRARARKPGFSSPTLPSLVRVPSGKITNISPAFKRRKLSLIPPRPMPSRSMGMASSELISHRNGAKPNRVSCC